MNPQITLVTLGVSDLAESIRFYRNGLGLPMQEREDDSNVVFFPLDGTWLSLYPRELLAKTQPSLRTVAASLESLSPTTYRRTMRWTKFLTKQKLPAVVS